MGCWAITPEKIEHSLNERKNIVQLAKRPPPPSAKSDGPSLRYFYINPKRVSFRNEMNFIPHLHAR